MIQRPALNPVNMNMTWHQRGERIDRESPSFKLPSKIFEWGWEGSFCPSSPPGRWWCHCQNRWDTFGRDLGNTFTPVALFALSSHHSYNNNYMSLPSVSSFQLV
uniref:Uncharacterized protein n=1 Tax=Macaca nemestrina TaxID=9545 RepID=A0A2K6D788_MACNE